ncbi:glutathione peroxidase [Polynucleobacter brandtiae]|uniref:Glutathione peroxidase n=1 Tax=Polynucleobacter brandtiae TaxID=1938816 RepID=A0A2M8VH87_9BURK|nr:hypothetical protein [Polynucleobacter brandtiae]PJI76053.1 glutathione peroxidase [Polynucleobacter brandtiae]
MLPNIELQRINGTHELMFNYVNKVLLVVNVASQCGFTPQYKELQALYDEFNAQGFEILAFPCNQFGGQEPGTSTQIEQFCCDNYGVTFPLFQKTDVNGPNTHLLFEYLKTAAPGLFGTQAIKWNFTKFLVGRNGLALKRYASSSTPASIRSDIKEQL